MISYYNIKNMKIYTKTGDKGYTGLIGGGRTMKNDVRVEIYGTLDELSSFIGLLKTENGCPKEVIGTLDHIQSTLIGLNCLFAISDNKNSHNFAINTEEITLLEKIIDKYSGELPPVTEFLVPGANKLNALANVCRTVCRRAERRIYDLELCDDQKTAAIYINRLSDYFFILGRRLSE